MRTELCDRLGIEFPIFAFTHCRDVVAAVSNAGGLGVLGAVGFTPEQLATELEWIDEHTDRPYGVDVVIPGKYEGMGELDPVKLEKELDSMIPEEHREFAKGLLADHGVPEMPDDELAPTLIGWTEATARPLVDEALAHDKVKLIANALGTPPPEIIDQIHESGRVVAALCGSPAQAARHRDAGVDIVIAQGGEGGGHTGDVGSMVLWPEVIDEVAPLPVLAAGGIGSGRQMAAALERLKTDVAAGNLAHDADPVMLTHVRNARRVRRSGGIVIGKPNDHQKIDLAMADALAHEAACDARTAGLTKPTQPARVLVL